MYNYAYQSSPADDKSVSIAILGSGGSGVMTAGNLILEAAGNSGLYGQMVRSSGPQIRGGEAAALLRLGNHPINNLGDNFDLLLAIDWKNADRFVGEITLHKESLVVGPADAPTAIRELGGRPQTLDLAELARETEEGRANMVAVGLVGALLGLSRKVLAQAIENSLARKGEAAVEAGLRAMELGIKRAADHPGFDLSTQPFDPSTQERWNITGNEAVGLGAIRGGIRFVAAYPITPATEVLEWLAPALKKIGGVLVQAEDELASVNQIIGASFAGTPALTATSGPGFSLMTESIGLAVASETPIVVVDVMRGGPSTGIPTKSEQSDLNIALYGLHGDAPHLVLAPSSTGDCVFTTQWATHLAETLQTAAIVLSDQSLGQTRAIIDRPADIAFLSGGRKIASRVAGYQRYLPTDSGVSPMTLPGTPGGQYTADGLEHSPRGTPSSRGEDHLEQLEKRQRKLLNHDYGEHWAEIDGDGELAVITWGSCHGPVTEAVRQLRAEGLEIRVITPRLLAPALPEKMDQALSGVKQILVVEQCHGAQFLHYLKASYDLPVAPRSLAIPGPLPIRPSTVLAALNDMRNPS